MSSAQTSLLNFRLIHLTAHSVFPLGYQVGISNLTFPRLKSYFLSKTGLSIVVSNSLKWNSILPVASAKTFGASLTSFFLYFYSMRKPLSLYHLNISIIHHLHWYHLGARQVSSVFWITIIFCQLVSLPPRLPSAPYQVAKLFFIIAARVILLKNRLGYAPNPLMDSHIN